MNTKEKINNFIKNRDSFDLFLPDGAYGRPWDNIYYLKEIIESDSELTLILNNDMCLNFFGDLTLHEKENRLSISEFKKLYFKVNGRIEGIYDYGEVILYVQ